MQSVPNLPLWKLVKKSKSFTSLRNSNNNHSDWHLSWNTNLYKSKQITCLQIMEVIHKTHLPGIPLVPPHIRKKTSLRTLDFQLSTPGPWKDLGIRCRRQSVVSTQPSTVLVAPFLAQLAPENRSYPYIFTKVKFFLSELPQHHARMRKTYNER